MIKFLKDNRVLVKDHKGYAEFDIRELKDGETLMDYMGYIMNTYWYLTGKNKRRYQDEVE